MSDAFSVENSLPSFFRLFVPSSLPFLPSFISSLVCLLVDLFVSCFLPSFLPFFLFFLPALLSLLFSPPLFSSFHRRALRSSCFLVSADIAVCHSKILCVRAAPVLCRFHFCYQSILYLVLTWRARQRVRTGNNHAQLSIGWCT